jgi:hypothetical protein
LAADEGIDADGAFNRVDIQDSGRQPAKGSRYSIRPFESATGR